MQDVQAIGKNAVSKGAELTNARLNGAFDEPLALLQEDALMLQRGTLEDSRHALHNDPHRCILQQPHCHRLVCTHALEET